MLNVFVLDFTNNGHLKVSLRLIFHSSIQVLSKNSVFVLFLLVLDSLRLLSYYENYGKFLIKYSFIEKLRECIHVLDHMSHKGIA